MRTDRAEKKGGRREVTGTILCSWEVGFQLPVGTIDVGHALYPPLSFSSVSPPGPKFGSRIEELGMDRSSDPKVLHPLLPVPIGHRIGEGLG